MRLIFRMLFAACVVAGVQPVTWADDAANASDPVRAHLDSAKSINANARKQAADALRAACDAAIAVANQRQQADLAAQIKAQEDAFNSSGAVPSLPDLRAAVQNYREAVDVADSNLGRAFARAIRHYAAQKQDALALDVEREKTALLQQLSGAAAHLTSGNAPNPAETAEALTQAKALYRTHVEDARQTLLAKVDARLNEAFNAGDLQAVRQLQGVEDALKAGSPVPESADPAVLAAVANFHRAIQAANVRMARDYSQAVTDFTRGRQIDQATAVQSEFVSCGLSGIDLAAVSTDSADAAGDTTYVLGRRLPEFLTSTDRWDARDRGIALQRRGFIRSKSGDYLNRDFTCDFWFTTETTGTYIFIGMGEGHGRPSDDVPRNSLALAITSPDNADGMVGVLRGDGQIDPIGRLDAGDYVARIQKVGNVLTLSVGDEDPDGAFNPRFSRSITDPSVLAPFITAHNGHLFFGGGRFWKLRYINGKPSAIIPDNVVSSLAGT